MTRILMLLPTLKRPEQCRLNLGSWLAHIDPDPDVSVECVVAADWNDPKSSDLYGLMSEMIATVGYTNVRLTFGKPAGKIGATNRELPGFDLRLGQIRPGVSVRDYADIVIAHSDDMWPGPNADGWASKLAAIFNEKDPNFDSVLWCSDGYRQDLLTWPVLGAGFLDRLRYVYSPEYLTEWADNDLHMTAARWGKLIGGTNNRQSRQWHEAWEGFVEHKHPAAGKAEMDENYRQNLRADWQAQDRETYQRREPQIGRTMPEAPTLSILIPTVPERTASLERLLARINASGRGIERRYEVVIDRTLPVLEGGPSIGRKRQALLDRSCGEYVAFIDDDDDIHPLYIERVLGAIDGFKATAGEGPDVVSLVVDRRDIDRGGIRTLWLTGIRYPTWLDRDGGEPDPLIPDGYAGVRSPNHVNPMRREHALKAGFGDSSWSEDRDFSIAVFGYLRSEASAGTEPLYVYQDSRENSLAHKCRAARG